MKVDQTALWADVEAEATKARALPGGPAAWWSPPGMKISVPATSQAAADALKGRFGRRRAAALKGAEAAEAGADDDGA